MIKVATSFDIKYDEMSDEELYAVVREHIMRDLGLYPDNPLDLAGNASSGKYPVHRKVQTGGRLGCQMNE